MFYLLKIFDFYDNGVTETMMGIEAKEKDEKKLMDLLKDIFDKAIKESSNIISVNDVEIEDYTSEDWCERFLNLVYMNNNGPFRVYYEIVYYSD